VGSRAGGEVNRTTGQQGLACPPLVSVLTPTIRERAEFLIECAASVRAQTMTAWEHLVQEDTNRDGCSVTINRLASAAEGEWLLPIADDDLLLPGCIKALLAASSDADVVYAPPLVTGNEDRWWFFQAPPVIPSTALIRRSLWDELGGYDEALRHEEDRDLWVKALNAGARFVKTTAPTWIYRQHGANKSFNKTAG
jgi:glycosyltransferase involved in cell wall biosynthesis